MISDKFNLLRFVLVSMLCISIGTGTTCAAPPVNPPEDFVKASVVIAGPGESLYSCAGHAALRMQCPSEKMDYCFSYESEEISSKVLTFLEGRLRMGMAVVPTPNFFESYDKEGRSLTEYTLNLPIAVKQNLWRILDNCVDRGMFLPYDYMERGCSLSILHFIEEALGNEQLEIGDLPPIFDKSRRVLFLSEIDHTPWTKVALNVLVNGSINDDVDKKEKAITPKSLITVLQNSRINGMPVISSTPITVFEQKNQQSPLWITPSLVGLLVLILTFATIITGKNFMLKVLVALQFALGLLNVYLIFISDLCATEWSWLLIPFNPLPALFWKWRAKWEIPYAAVISIWCLAMMFMPGSLTDALFIVLGASIVSAYLADRLLPEGISRQRFESLFGKSLSNFISKLKPIHQ